MKIASIAVRVATLELRVPFTTSFGTQTTLQRPFVIVESNDGRRGVGEAPTMSNPAYKPEADTPSVLTSLEHFILPSVRDFQASESEVASVADLRRSYEWIKGATFAKSGVEAAIWDLLAQESDQPLWQLWGGTRRSFPVGVSIGGQTIEQVLSRAENAVSQGYQRLKVKIWPGFDVEVARALREAFPDVLLQVDANSAYNRETWRGLRALDGLDLLLIEQPLYDDDIVLHSEISAELQTPVCLDESVHSLRDAEAAISLWAARDNLARLIINIKPPRVGGFAEAIAIADMCRARGVRTWVGGMLDSAWGKAMNLQFNSLEAIDLPGDHFSPAGPYFVDDVTLESLAAPGGVFTPGEGASTGLTFDWERFTALSEPRLTLNFDG